MPLVKNIFYYYYTDFFALMIEFLRFLKGIPISTNRNNYKNFEIDRTILARIKAKCQKQTIENGRMDFWSEIRSY